MSEMSNKKVKTNKTREVLKFMRKAKSKGITSWQAIELFGATRLSAIVFNLKKQGYGIATVDMEDVDRYGNAVRFCKYVLTKDIA